MSDLAQTAADVVANYEEVRETMIAAARAAGRDPAGVHLVAVTKMFGPERIRPVIAAGHRLFGENRVQEAAEKWPALRADCPDLELHLIGPLQTNKVKDAVALFDVIETLDRPKLARKIAQEFEKQQKRLRLFVQVNTGEEEQKAGVLPRETDAFIARCREEFALSVDGLMCIPPADEEPAMHFALLAKIAARNGIGALSMGMSADYETAITFGATHVRIGTAIFGERPARI